MAERSGAGDVVEMRGAPRPELIATVPAVASDVAARAHFDLDAATDVRMAVDEACNEVARHTDPSAVMRVVFEVRPDGLMRVAVSAPADPESGRIDTEGFGWRVLGCLVDELVTDYVIGDSGTQVMIRLVKSGGAL